MFVVFGASRTKAGIKAEQTVSMHDKDGQALPLSEYSEKLKEATKSIYRRMKPGKISPIYSSPSLAEKYIECANRSGSADRMRIRKAATVEVDEKTNKSKIIWEDI